MTAKKQPMQADGRGTKKGAPDGVSQTQTSGRNAAGESGGGAYPNPHRGKTPKDSPSDFLGTGGQTEMGYFGPGQIDGKKADPKKRGRVGQGG
jgi:hypothetical protein